MGALADGAAAHAAFYLTASGVTVSAESHQVSVYTTRPDLAGGALCQASFPLSAATDIAAAANKVDSVTYSATPQLGGQLVITVRGNTGTIGAAGDATVTPASYSTWPSDAYRLTGSQITLTGGNTGVFPDDLYLSGLNSAATAYTAEFTFAVVGTTASATGVSPMSHIASGAQVKHTSTSNFGTLTPIPQVVNTTTMAMTASPTTLPSTGGTGTYTVTVTNEGALPITLDDISLSIPPGASYVPGSATFGGDPVGDPSISGGDAIFLAGLDVPAGASRELTVEVAIPGEPGDYTASAAGHIGDVVLDTTLGTGDSTPPTAGIIIAGPPPTVTGLDPETGPADGGTTVTITGTGFTGATEVMFGDRQAASFTVVDSTTITAVSPAGIGAVDVVVTTVNGTSATSPDSVFTYDAPPVPPPTPADLTSTGSGTTPQTATVTIPSDGSATLLDAAGNPTNGPVTVPDQGSYDLSGTTITFTPVPGFTGDATPVTYRVTDKYGRTGDATYTPTVNEPAAPAPADLTSTGAGTTPQTATITIPSGGSATLLDANGNPTDGTVTVPGEGSYKLSGTTITFTPVPGFTGEATPVTYRITDQHGQVGGATYTPTVTIPPPPSAPDRETSGIGTTPQSTTVPVPPGGTITLLDADDNPADSVAFPGEGTYSLVLTENAAQAFARAALADITGIRQAPATAADIVFTAVLGYIGTAPPVDYQVTDAYGQTAIGTYTPTVVLPPPPPAPPQASEGSQDNPQQVTLPVPPGGTVVLIDAEGNAVTTVVIPGQGTYTLDSTTGVLTFTPLPGFTGQPDPVTYRITDAYGQSTTGTYAPAVVALPATDIGAPAADGLPTTGTPLTTLTLVGVGLLTIGAATIALARRRPAHAAQDDGP